MINLRLPAAGCLLLGLLHTSVQAGDWPAFRGPTGDGVAREETAPLQWGPDKNVKWKAKLPRPANGSPIVSKGRVFVTSAEDDEGRRRSLYCFDRRSGEQMWSRTVELDRAMPTHKTNPYCGSTPVSDGQRVVVWHASAGLHCYDMDGQPLWSRDLGEFRHTWGYGTSPVIYQDKVILHTGPGQEIFITALDVATGKTLWRTDEPHQGDGSSREDGKYMGSWSTPVIARIDGRDQIVCTMPTRVVSYSPDDGAVIWYCEGIRGPKGDLAYSSPLISEGLCVAIGGFQGPGLAVKLGGTGNITGQRLWRNERNPQSIGSGVLIDGYVYRANAGPGTIDCLDAQTEEIKWTERATGANNWGSIIYVGGRCYLTNQSGVTVVFKPSPRGCEILAQNELGESSNSTPAVSNGEVFLRTFEHLYCIAE